MGEAWLPLIYRDKIRPQRTRSIKLDIPARENQASIQYTLLGIELKVGKKRFACPDLSTARYFRVFARLGIKEFAVIYDITKIPAAADELENSWQLLLVMHEEYFKGRPDAARARGRTTLLTAIRNEVLQIGSGEAMPLFDQMTRQRAK